MTHLTVLHVQTEFCRKGKGGGGCDNADDAVGNFYDGNGDESKDVGS